MDTPNRSSGAGGLVVALIIGLVVGFTVAKVLAPAAPAATTVPTTAKGFVAQPCASGSTATITLDSSGQPSCVQTGAKAGDTVSWATTPGYYPWVRFNDPVTPPAVSMSQGSSSWSPLATYTPGATFDYQINVFKGTVTPPTGTQVTPTPQLYGRIIIVRP